MLRNIGALLAGILVVGLVVGGLQLITQSLYPLPEGIDPFDPASADALAQHMAGLPITAWLLVLASEVVGVFLGALVAGMIAGSRKAMVVALIAALGLAGSVFNWVSFPHPAWFMIVQTVAYAAVFFLVKQMVEAGGTSAS